MRGGIRRFDYNHKVDKLVSTHPLGDCICVRCKTVRFEVGTKNTQIGSNACGYNSDDGVTMNAGVGINGQQNNL